MSDDIIDKRFAKTIARDSKPEAGRLTVEALRRAVERLKRESAKQQRDGYKPLLIGMEKHRGR